MLNQNAIIVMTLTGEDYIDSAKTGVSLIWDNLELFIIVQIMDDIITLTGVICSVGIPSVIGFFVLQYGYVPEPSTFEMAISLILIFILSLMIALLALGMFGIVINCVYIFYCLDKKFYDMGISIPSAPKEVLKLFEIKEGEEPPQTNQSLNRMNT